MQTCPREDGDGVLVGCGSTQGLEGSGTVAIGPGINPTINPHVFYNSFFGGDSGSQANVKGSNNTFLGAFSGYKATIGTDSDMNKSKNHVFIGHESGFQITLEEGMGNTFIGFRAGANTNTNDLKTSLDPNDNPFLSRVTNIGNGIIIKTGSTSNVPKEIYDNLPNEPDHKDTILLKGNVKICDDDGCSARIKKDDIIPNLKNTIDNLKAKIRTLKTALCQLTPPANLTNFCNSSP